MSSKTQKGQPQTRLKIAVLTISDSRDLSNDTSGQFLCDQLQQDGHELSDRAIVVDDCYQLRARFSTWIADPNIDAIISTGGTGFSSRDNTPDAVRPLLDQHIDGFGELFRQLSYDEIGTSTVQSRALAGIANHTLIFCLPGSTGACKTAWHGILREQLDSRHQPCNFVAQTRAGS